MSVEKLKVEYIEEAQTFLQTEKISKEKLHKDVTCGFWIFKGDFLQSFATEKIYALIYGIGGCILTMSQAYFNGSLTTLEKRFKIPTKNSGIIIIAHDISMLITSLLAGYYVHRVHRPRWIGLGFFTIIFFCLVTSSLHFIYGPGEEALKLTQEYGSLHNSSKELHNGSSHSDHALCMSEEPICQQEEGFWVPQVILFVGELISGVGISLFWTVGVAYMDDNTSKSKAPAMLSASAFLRMLGPALGYSLCSMCLRSYIEPSLHPLIKPGDPRWLGAWWLGWIILAAITFLIAFIIALFPKELPSARARREHLENSGLQDAVEHIELSLSHMWQSVKRLAVNKVYVYNSLGSILYFFGYIPWWIYTPKYIETQYRQSASMATMATGTVALGFSALGIILSGCILSKFRPSARLIAALNALVDFLTAAGIVCYIFIGCKGIDHLKSITTTGVGCSASCHCEYVHYAPICTTNNVTFISACHAGCTGTSKDPFGRTVYTGCECINPTNSTGFTELPETAVDGACPVDCTNQFIIFLSVMCFIKLVGSFSKSNTMILALRCMDPKDKSLGLGFGGMVAALLAFIPSPVFFGWILDKYCLVWGKTCSNKGNCWLYETESLRFAFNITSASFVVIAGLFNIGVWRHAKDLQIFDSKEKTKADNCQLTEVSQVCEKSVELEKSKI